MEHAAEGETAQAAPAQAEGLADQHRVQGDPTRVLAGRPVGALEVEQERADARAEERLGVAHQRGRRQVARQRPRRRRAAQVEGDRRADERDRGDLEPVTEPPPELVVAKQRGADRARHQATPRRPRPRDRHGGA